MSPQLTSQGMVLATTAAMAVSGTVILLALFRLHNKTLPPDSQFHPSSPQLLLRSCISSSSDERRSRGDKSCNTNLSKKKKKRVRFADNVTAYPDIIVVNNNKGPCSCPNPSTTTTTTNNGDKVRGMPANRMALYSGILSDRVNQRMAYSY